MTVVKGIKIGATVIGTVLALHSGALNELTLECNDMEFYIGLGFLAIGLTKFIRTTIKELI